jgi:hypothetical protein
MTTEVHKRQDRSLAERRREIISLPAHEALSAILDAPRPTALIRSFPEGDFYVMIHELGTDDALELIRRASYRQWEYILDLDGWRGDRMALDEMSRWLETLIRAAPDRMIRWFRRDKTDLIEYYLYRNLGLIVREHDQDPSDFGDGWLTLDDVFYFRPVALPPDWPQGDQEARDQFLSSFLTRLAADNYETYQRVMLELPGILPAESEEDAYRLRNVRLAEAGFMPRDEAVGIYRPLDRGHLIRKRGKRLPVASSIDDPPPPLIPAAGLDSTADFSRALAAIDSQAVLEALQGELAGLSNRIIAADDRPVRSREALREVVAKTCGYLGIGLEVLSGQAAPLDPGKAAALLKRYPLDGIFRVGYGRAAALGQNARRWYRTAWAERRGLPLSFWDEAGMGVLGGLLLPRPLCYDPEAGPDHHYREFAGLDDIHRTASALETLMALDRHLDRMDPPLPETEPGLLTYKSLLLTLWVRHRLGLPESAAPVELPRFRTLYPDLWDPDGGGRMAQAAKTDFRHYLAERGGTGESEVDRLGGALKALFEEIEDEYGPVSAGSLDPRYIRLFRVADDGKEPIDNEGQ